MDRLSQYVIKHSSCLMPRCEYVENGIEISCDRCQERMIQEHDAKVRAGAIEEIKHQMISIHTDMIFRYGVDTIEARSDAFDELKEWLKEQK